jgi:hypothetical protein
MYQFCFNDCIPDTASEHSLRQCLIDTLQQYNEVKKEYPNEVDGVVTSVSIHDFILNAQLNYSLASCVSGIPDKDLRTIAYRIFTKYPIDKHYSDIDDEDLLQNDYAITIGGTKHVAFNPVITSLNNGVLFTLGLHQDLRKNVLTVGSNTNATVDVNNLFGLDINTTYVKDLIKQSTIGKPENFQRLLEIIGDHTISPRFKKSFDRLSSQVQIAILEHFEAAKNRNGITPFFSDNDLVKDVSQQGIAFRVFELRIFQPVPFRVYFYEAQNKIYLAMVEKKPSDKKQDSHIDSATSIISQMLLMQK